MPIFRSLLTALLFVAIFVGCNRREAPLRVVTPSGPSEVQVVKSALEEIAATGVLGEPAKVIKRKLESIAEDEFGLMALEPDFKHLVSLSDPAAIKAKARQMADRLEGGKVIPSGSTP
jgi:hypothetical protein